jgi:hypothetical protein
VQGFSGWWHQYGTTGSCPARDSYRWWMTNLDFLGASSKAALTMIGEHAPVDAVIVQVATVCRLIDRAGGVYVVTDVNTFPDWTPQPELPTISDTLEEEARKLRLSGPGYHVSG